MRKFSSFLGSLRDMKENFSSNTDCQRSLFTWPLETEFSKILAGFDEVGLRDRESISSFLNNRESRSNKAKVQSILIKAKLIKYTKCGNIPASMEDFIEKVEALVRTVAFNPYQEKELLKALKSKVSVEFTGNEGSTNLQERDWEDWNTMKNGLKMSELFFYSYLLRTFDTDDVNRPRSNFPSEPDYSLKEYEKKQNTQQQFFGRKEYERRDQENFQVQKRSYQQKGWQDSAIDKNVAQNQEKRKETTQNKKESDTMQKPDNLIQGQNVQRFHQNANQSERKYQNSIVTKYRIQW